MTLYTYTVSCKIGLVDDLDKIRFEEDLSMAQPVISESGPERNWEEFELHEEQHRPR